MPTSTARLTGWVPAVDHDQLAAGLRGFVLNHAPQSSPAGIPDRLGKPAVSDHVLHREVFDHDRVVVANKLRTGAVQKVSTGGSDFPVRASHFRLSLGAVGRPLLTTRHTPLIAGQVATSPFEVPRIVDQIPVAGDGETLEPQVHANCVASRGKRIGIVALNREADIPAAIRITRHRDRCRINRCRINIGPRPHELKRNIHLRQQQLAVTPAEAGPRVLSGLTAGARFEPRVPSAFSEEVSVRGLLGAQRLLKGNRRDLTQPGQIGVLLHRGQISVGGREVRPLSLAVPAGMPPRESPIPHHTHTPECAVQDRNLFRGRVGPTLVRRTHGHSLTRRSEMDKPRRKPYLPVAKARGASGGLR